MHFSSISGRYDNEPVTFECDWAEFVDLLRGYSEQPSRVADKLDTECFCPARYPHGALRAKANVLSWDWAAVDLDDGAWSFPDTVELMRLSGLSYIVYTTTSHTPEKQKLRAIFPLSEAVTPDRFAAFWYALNQMFGGHLDPATKDISRVFFGPRAWEGVDNGFAADANGAALDPVALTQRFPAPPEAPRPVMKAVTWNAPETAPRGDLAYAKATFDRVIEELHRHGSTTTGFNNLLNSAAYTLAGFVASRLLDERIVKDALENAAQGHGSARLRTTIKSGWTAGERNPRTAPAPTKRRLTPAEMRRLTKKRKGNE